MGTQKHGLGDDTRPPKEVSGDEPGVDDLGIPTDGPVMTEDPTGFQPRAEPQVVAGRRVRPLQEGELSESHRQYAGDKTPMFGVDSFNDQAPKPEQMKAMPPPQTRHQSQQQRRAHDEKAQATAQRLLPDYLNQQAPPPIATGQPAQAYAAPDPSTSSAEADQLADFKMAQTSAALEYLTKEEQSARERGDYLAAEQARNMTNRLSDDFDIKRIPQGEGRHPAMAKLMANLGLEKIKRVEIPWGGSSWMFAPTNATLDGWVSSLMEEDGRNFAALVVAAGLVGLDGVPIYEAMRIPLDAQLVITDKATGKQRKVDVALYRKICDCGFELVVTDEKCINCGSLHDPFDIPVDLRKKCAEAILEMFENKFGAYEELAFLLDEKNKAMPDRTTDKETLYPLAMPSPEQKATTDSQSGGEL